MLGMHILIWCFSLYWCPDFNFSVNCGGPEIRSTSGALFEKDEEALGPASFFVSKAQRWAVSNVGLPIGSNSNEFIALSTAQFANTSDSELFQSARLSASSLRYYGLGLENGGYTLTVQFSEIQIQGSRTWRSLGRRVFDIYVQVSTMTLSFSPYSDKILLIVCESVITFLVTLYNFHKPWHIMMLSTMCSMFKWKPNIQHHQTQPFWTSLLSFMMSDLWVSSFLFRENLLKRILIYVQQLTVLMSK